MNAQKGSRGILLLSMTFVLDEMGGQCHAQATLPPEKGPGTLYTGGWVGSRDGLEECGPSRTPPGFDPRTI